LQQQGRDEGGNANSDAVMRDVEEAEEAYDEVDEVALMDLDAALS